MCVCMCIYIYIYIYIHIYIAPPRGVGVERGLRHAAGDPAALRADNNIILRNLTCSSGSRDFKKNRIGEMQILAPSRHSFHNLLEAQQMQYPSQWYLKDGKYVYFNILLRVSFIGQDFMPAHMDVIEDSCTCNRQGCMEPTNHSKIDRVEGKEHAA